MATLRDIVTQYLGRAHLAKDMDARHAALREGANVFMGLAFNPRNARVSPQLAAYARQFAQAAHFSQEVTVDDFTDLLRETDQAYHEVGEDPMDLVARRREIHDARTPQERGHISISPPTFTRDATLGRSADVKFNPTAQEIANGVQQVQTVAFWQGFKKEAQAMTVDVNLVSVNNGDAIVAPPPPLDPNNPIAPAFAVRSYAEVGFGSDGNITKVRFDIGQGKRLTVIGNYIEVNVGCLFPGKNSAGVLNPTTVIRAGASIGPFAAPSPAPLVYTTYVENETGSDSLFGGEVSFQNGQPFIQIPVKAVLLLPMQTTLAIGKSATIDFYDWGKSPIYSVNYTQAVNNTMLPVPVTGDAAWVRVTNGLGNDQARFRLPWQLAL